MTEELCKEKVNRGDSRWTKFEPCGRPAVEDGLCKLHLRVRNRRDEKDAAMRATWERGDALVADAEALSNKLGFKVVAHYNSLARGGGRYTGDFVVPGDWLRKIAEERR